MAGQPLVIYIPGLLPKPAAEPHRRELLRCLLAGIRRLDVAVADEIAGDHSAFDLVSWTFDFYGEHRDIELDLPDIESALSKGEPDEIDITDAVHWKRRAMHAMYKLGDRLPFLIPRLANEKLEIHMRDLRRYAQNQNDIGEHVRRLLKVPLEAAEKAGRPVLLLAHSMGSMIAWDALWQLSRREKRRRLVDTLITMGSPIGGNYVQERLMGFNEPEGERFPDNIGLWHNLSAVGELTALDRTLRNDFGRMISLGLVDDIVDREIFTWYRSGDDLNVHNEYGYLMHERTARLVRDWWRTKRPARG